MGGWQHAVPLAIIPQQADREQGLGRGDPKAQLFTEEKQICSRACCCVTVAKGYQDYSSLSPLDSVPGQNLDLEIMLY